LYLILYKENSEGAKAKIDVSEVLQFIEIKVLFTDILLVSRME